MTAPTKRSKLARSAKPMPSDSACRIKGSKSPAANADDNVTRSNTCPLVMIEWEDSAQPIPAWRFLADFEAPGIIVCASVGWMIRDDDQMKALAPNMGALNDENSVQVSGVIQIPTRCVRRITPLSEPTLEA
jgi:hypothetical protein